MAQQTVFFPFDNHLDDTRGEVFAETDNFGGVTFTTGLVNNAADFSGSSQKVTSSDSFFHNITGFDFEMVGWVRLDAVGQNHGLFGQTTSSYHCHVIGTDKVRWRVNTAGGSVILDSTGTLSVDTWYRIRVGYDHSAGEIYQQIDNGTVETKTTGGSAISTGTQDMSWGSIGSGNYMNGKQELFMMRREGVFTTTELDDHYNSGSGQAFDTELELDYVTDSDARRVKVQAKSAQIGGTGTQDCYHLVIDHNSLPGELHDSDETATVEASGAGSLRVSTDEAGTNMVPCKVKAFTPASGGGSAEIWLNNGSTLDGTSGTDFYLWWLPSGHGKSQPPAGHVYGSQAVFPDSVVGAWLDDDFSDATSNGNDGTATGTTTSTSAPFGVGSYDFDGTDDRIVIADDSTLDLEGDIFLEMWFNCDSDTGSFQGLVTKRLGTTNNYSLAFDVGGNMDWNYVNTGTFRGSSTDFSTNFGTGTWYRVAATMTGATDTEIFKNTTSLDSDSLAGTHPQNSETLKLGNIENVSGTFTDFPFDGKMKAVMLHNSIPSSDIRTTLDNNQKAPGTFWDSTAAVTSPASTGVTGTLSLTDGGETLAFTGEVPVTGTMTLTDGGEDLDFTGNVPISGTMSLTDGGEVLTFSGLNTTNGTMTLTDGGETISMTGEVPVTGSLDITDGGESLTFSGSLGLSGTLAITDGGETIALTGSVPVTGTMTLTDGGETLSFTNAVSLVARSPFKVKAETRIFTVYPNC